MQDFETLNVAVENGVEIILRRSPRPGALRLLLSHGNGFAIGGYRKFWDLLAPDFELCLFDLRNHGLNPRTPLEEHSIAAMAADHVAIRKSVADAFGARKTLGLFHSVSSIAAIMAARDHGLTWDGLILFDPPLIAPEGNALRPMNQKLDENLRNFATNRQSHFQSVAELTQHLQQKLGRNWVEGAAADMAEATLRPAPEGGYELSCPGAYEAKIYAENSAFGSFEAAAHLKQPTFLICADPQAPRALPPAFSGPQAAAQFGFDCVSVAETGHLLQIEKPEIVAEHVRRYCAQFTA